MILRPYQQAAVDSIFAYYEKKDGNVLLVLPTSAGKSVIQAAFIKEVLSRWPNERFMLVTHVKELLVQNAAKLKSLGIDASLYSAGLGKKEIGQITIAGIQSVYNQAHKLGDISIAIVDESHLLSKKANSMYGKLFAGLRRLCPHLKVIGMSATPFRLDSGPLHKGDHRIFTDIAYHISIKELIALGYLSPLVNTRTETRADISRVKKKGGEYIPSQLETAMNLEPITKAALDEAEKHLQDRKSWLVFCSGVNHAHAVAAEITARGYPCKVVVGTTPKQERADSIAEFVAGKLRALVSVGVLTTGFDAPCADALICLRPTCSPGLWVQMVGRITRLSPGKINGLVLDFTDNTKTHGPIDLITIDGDGNVKTNPERLKICHQCFIEVPYADKVCPKCGLEFPQEQIAPRKPKHNTHASDAEILSSGKPTIKVEEVTSWEFRRHKKEGKPDSVKVTYHCGLIDKYDEWLCFDHGGFASQKAWFWWQRYGGAGRPNTNAALASHSSLSMPKQIGVKREGKYWRVH